MIKAFIFDFDGVIVDSLNIKTKAFARLFENEGKEIIRKVITYHLSNAGVSRYEKFKYIYKEMLNRPLSKEVFQELCARFENMVVESVIDAPAIKGADEFLKANLGRFSYFLISATPRREIVEIVRRRKISSLFKRIYGAPVKKSEAAREILLKEGLRFSDVIYIGDALSDYQAANDNSLRFIGIGDSADSVFTGIDCIKIRDFTQLEKVIALG